MEEGAVAFTRAGGRKVCIRTNEKRGITLFMINIYLEYLKLEYIRVDRICVESPFLGFVKM